MRRIIASALALPALIFVGVMPANAHDGYHAVDDWETIDTAGETNDYARSTSAHSTIDSFTADATWASDEPASAGGTSIETSNLGLDVSADDTVSVDYELIDGASPASGSTRLFIFLDSDADTSAGGSAPFAEAIAPDDDTTSGTLTLTVPSDGTIGTAGLVYDTSNGGVEGTVRFSNLTVDETKISFEPTPEVAPEEPTSTNETCAEEDTGTVTGTIMIPDNVAGVSYSVNGQDVEPGEHDEAPGKYDVTATADDGYVLTDDVSEWTLDIAVAEDCETPSPSPSPTDDTSTNDDDDESTNDDDEKTSTLPETGMSNASLIGIAGALLVAGGVLTFMGYRHRRVAKYAAQQ